MKDLVQRTAMMSRAIGLARKMQFVPTHFGEWLQGCIMQPDGCDTVGLVTLMCPQRGVRACMTGAGRFSLSQTRPVLSTADAASFLAALGLPVSGCFALQMDFPPGGGAGMSTAARVALARATGMVLSNAAGQDRLAAACLASEGASDPLMLRHPDRVLWASRQARGLADLPAPPCARIIGGFWGAAQRTDPLDTRFAPVDDLLSEWVQGPALPRAAALATESAVRTTQLRGPAGDPTARLAQDMGALGWVRAHTGSARGLIFAPDATPDPAAMSEAGFTGVLTFLTAGRA